MTHPEHQYDESSASRSEGLLHRFLRELFRDKAGAGIRSLEYYLERFPEGDPEAIRREFTRATDDTAPFSEPEMAQSFRQIGPFRILRRLGRGGMGSVFLAHREGSRRPYAVKILSSMTRRYPELVARFAREAELARRVSHRNVLHVHELGEDNGVPFIVMDVVVGESLARRLTRHRGDRPRPGRAACGLPWRRLTRIVEKVALALQACHDKGIVHRDVKPHNITMTGREDPVLVDFGLARCFDASLAKLTSQGTLLGSVPWMSPEQVAAVHDHDIEVDARTDIYSLGVTLYELITGHRPFPGITCDDIARIHTETPVAIQRFVVDAPSELVEICRRAMSRSVEDRYPSAAIMALDLADCRRRLSGLRGFVRRVRSTTRFIARVASRVTARSSSTPRSGSGATPPTITVQTIA